MSDGGRRQSGGRPPSRRERRCLRSRLPGCRSPRQSRASGRCGSRSSFGLSPPKARRSFPKSSTGLVDGHLVAGADLLAERLVVWLCPLAQAKARPTPCRAMGAKAKKRPEDHRHLAEGGAKFVVELCCGGDRAWAEDDPAGARGGRGLLGVAGGRGGAAALAAPALHDKAGHNRTHGRDVDLCLLTCPGGAQLPATRRASGGKRDIHRAIDRLGGLAARGAFVRGARLSARAGRGRKWHPLREGSGLALCGAAGFFEAPLEIFDLGAQPLVFSPQPFDLPERTRQLLLERPQSFLKLSPTHLGLTASPSPAPSLPDSEPKSRCERREPHAWHEGAPTRTVNRYQYMRSLSNDG